MAQVHFKRYLAIATLIGAFLGGCGGSQSGTAIPPAVTNTPAASSTAQTDDATRLSAPHFLTSGKYCDGPNDVNLQLQAIDNVESGFRMENPQKSLEEIIRLGNGLVVFARFPGSIVDIFVPGADKPVLINETQGYSLGAGYFVTTNRGLADVVSSQGSGYPLEIFADRLLLSYGTAEGNFSSLVQNVAALPEADLGLVYMPLAAESPKGFRSSSTLKKGETVYNITLSDSGPVVRTGEVIEISVGATAKDYPVSYSGQVLTSITAGDGDSGSPVFDSSGKLVGVVSVGSVLNGSPATTVASIGYLGDILSIQKRQLKSCEW